MTWTYRDSLHTATALLLALGAASVISGCRGARPPSLPPPEYERPVLPPFPAAKAEAPVAPVDAPDAAPDATPDVAPETPPPSEPAPAPAGAPAEGAGQPPAEGAAPTVPESQPVPESPAALSGGPG